MRHSHKPKQLLCWCITALFILSISDAEARINYSRKENQFFYSFKIVVFGDSLTSGYGLEPQQAYPTVLRKLLNKEFPRDRIEVVNAGVTGDTTSSAVSRVASILAEKPDIVVIALGGLDGIRRTDPDIIYKAMEQILSTLTHNNIYVLLCGFEAPHDADMVYAARYNSIFAALAKRYNVAFTPHIMRDITNVWYHLQFDGIHPNEDGMEQVARNLLRPTADMVRKLRSRML